MVLVELEMVDGSQTVVVEIRIKKRQSIETRQGSLCA